MSNNKLEKEETRVLATCYEEGCEVHAVTRGQANKVTNQDEKLKTKGTIKGDILHAPPSYTGHHLREILSEIAPGPILEANVAYLPKQEKEKTLKEILSRELEEDKRLEPKLKKVVRQVQTKSTR